MAAGLGVSAIYLFHCIGTWLEREPVFAAFGDFMGKISYSTYLFHIIAAQLLHQRLQSCSIAIQVVAFVSILVAFCSIFYLYFEPPILAARPSYGRGAKRPVLEEAS